MSNIRCTDLDKRDFSDSKTDAKGWVKIYGGREAKNFFDENGIRLNVTFYSRFSCTSTKKITVTIFNELLLESKEKMAW